MNITLIVSDMCVCILASNEYVFILGQWNIDIASAQNNKLREKR